MADVSNNYIAKAIYLASKENPDDLASRVVKFLAKKRLLSRAPGIILQLEKILYKIENKILVKVTSAEKLSSSEKSELEQFLKKRYEVKQILFKEIVDSRVIGGMKIEIDEEVLDSTIKNRIQKLQEHLIS